MKVAILMGSEKDKTTMQAAADVLAEIGIEHDVHVMSAHRTPERVAAFASGAQDDGYGVIICGAGKAAHLAGAVAAHTTLPVIGVPIAAGGLGGLDARGSRTHTSRNPSWLPLVGHSCKRESADPDQCTQQGPSSHDAPPCEKTG